MFTGFPQETVQYFLDIRFHNSMAYHHETKDRYLRDVQKPFYAFIQDIAPFMQEIDPQMEVRPHKCLARLRRDTRFTKDKSPYRDHLWITFHQAGEPRSECIHYWFEFGPDRLSWGLGFWGENKRVMERFRREMSADPARICGLIDSCDLPGKHLQLEGSVYKRMELPPQIPQRMRSWYTGRDLYIVQTWADRRWASSRELLSHVMADFRALAPIYQMWRGMMNEAEKETPSSLAMDAAPLQKVTLPKEEW